VVLVHEAVRRGWLCIRDRRSCETQGKKSCFESFLFRDERETVPVVEERVQAFVGRMRGLRESGEVVRFMVAMSAFTNGTYDAIQMLGCWCCRRCDHDVGVWETLSLPRAA